MFFLQAAQSRIDVRVGRKLLLKVPKFEIGDAIEWGQEVMQQEIESKTSGMNESQKAEFLNLYPPAGPDINSMRMLIRSDAGAKRVLRSCLGKAEAFVVKKERKDGTPDLLEKVNPLTPAQVEEYIRINGIGRLMGLAWVLADLDDASVIKPPAGYEDESLDSAGEQVEVESDNPLTGTGNAA